MSQQTVPAWAPRIWIEAGQIHLDCPGTATKQSHRLSVEDNSHGWARLRSVLTHRGDGSTLGTKGDLTQYQLEKLTKEQLRKDGLEAIGEVNLRPGGITKVRKVDTFSPALRQGARDVLWRLGLR